MLVLRWLKLMFQLFQDLTEKFLLQKRLQLLKNWLPCYAKGFCWKAERNPQGWKGWRFAAAFTSSEVGLPLGMAPYMWVRDLILLVILKQILADQHGHVVHLGERDCSLQRNQKVLEEAPSVAIGKIPSKIDAAVRAAQSVGYEMLELSFSLWWK